MDRRQFLKTIGVAFFLPSLCFAGDNDHSFKIGDLVKVSRPQQAGYVPWTGRIYNDDYNKSLGIEGLGRCSLGRDFKSGRTMWESIS